MNDGIGGLLVGLSVAFVITCLWFASNSNMERKLTYKDWEINSCERNINYYKGKYENAREESNNWKNLYFKVR